VVPAEVKARGQQVQAPYQQGKFIEAIPQQDPASREDAMLNSGIVLANANVSLRPDRTPSSSPAASESNVDDGYLTAKEAAQLRLRGTDDATAHFIERYYTLLLPAWEVYRY
jgi:hypothetical protein